MNIEDINIRVFFFLEKKSTELLVSKETKQKTDNVFKKSIKVKEDISLILCYSFKDNIS